MTDTYTIRDVTDDLRSLLKLTNLFDADEQGYWTMAGSNERFKYDPDKNNNGREIVLIQDPMPRGEYLTFNPFSEGLGKTNPATAFYYQSIRVAANEMIMVILFHVARALLTHKEAAAKSEEFPISPAVLHMASVPTNKRTTIYDIIDATMIDEFKKLTDRIDDTFFFVPYTPRDMTARLTCAPLTDAEWDAKFAGKDVRKRSVAAFKALIMGIFGITKPEELSQFSVKYSDLDVKSAPRFHATMLVYQKVYSRIVDVIPEAYTTNGVPSDKFVVDLGQLNETIERFPYAYAIAKHMMQPSAPSAKPTATTTSDTTAMRYTAPGTGVVGADGKASRFAGPPVVDEFGRQTRMAPTMQPTIAPAPSNRFKPPILEQNNDPFSPTGRTIGGGGGGQTMLTPGMGSTFMVPATMNPQTLSSGSAFGSTGFGIGHNSGFGSPGSGFNFNAPTNFGDPNARRWFP